MQFVRLVGAPLATLSDKRGETSWTSNNGGFMAVNLSKGENVQLSKAAPGLTSVLVGLGWDPPETDDPSDEWDLDASLFLLGPSGRVLSDSHFVFYNNLTSPDGAVVHSGDNRTGEGDGDDESIVINLAEVAPEVQRIVFAVTIHEGAALGRTFGQVENCFIRVAERRPGDPSIPDILKEIEQAKVQGREADHGVLASGPEIVRYDLGEDFSNETALVFGEMYRDAGDWKFEAVGQSPAGDLAGLCRLYGISV